jgi:indole-3-glycerol phosphate synthase
MANDKSNILDKLVVSSEKRSALLNEGKLREQAEALQATQPIRFNLETELRKPELTFICEIKKASPSKGIISQEFSWREIAFEYENYGADAISVLTEPDYFLGNNKYLTVIASTAKVPILRKDFTVSKAQIYEARCIGATAVLLIVSILKKNIGEYIKTAESVGLTPLVEAHTEREIKIAADAGARIIGINNRNLKTFKTDVSNALVMMPVVPRGVLVVAESGIRTRADIELLEEGGIHGVLIGEALMRSGEGAFIGNIGKTLQYLKGKC